MASVTAEDPATRVNDFPVSNALLAHDGLMTPKLTQFFGAVHAQQTDGSDAGDRILRWSTLYQTKSGAQLLRARLAIFKAGVPEGLLDRLLSGTRLFGSLVIEEGLSVRMAGQQIFQSELRGQGQATAWGRRHRILRLEDDAPICDVEERLEDEATLVQLLLPAQRDNVIKP